MLGYPYATGTFSSRKIAAKLHEDVAFRVLVADAQEDRRYGEGAAGGLRPRPGRRADASGRRGGGSGSEAGLGGFGFDAIVWYLAFVMSTTVHEAAHAWAAYIGGDPTPYQGGQVTLNPIPHIQREPFGMAIQFSRCVYADTRFLDWGCSSGSATSCGRSSAH